jgi:hypothetical protein
MRLYANCCENADVAAKPHVFCAALAANGTKRTYRGARCLVRFWGGAEIRRSLIRAKAGIQVSFQLSISQGVCSRSSTKVMVNGWPAMVFPSASMNGKDAHRLSVCATAMRYDERSAFDASLD